MTSLEQARALIRDVPDFPQPGILFKDLTPLLGEPSAFRAVIDELAGRVRDRGFHRIVAIESRGFLFGAALDDRLGLGSLQCASWASCPTRLTGWNMRSSMAPARSRSMSTRSALARKSS